MAADGRSFVTAMALQNTSLWVHDRTGERKISLEGNTAQPRFTPDGKKLLCRIVNEPPNESGFFKDLAELRIVDLVSGRSEPLVRGLRALDYDISRDGSQVVMETVDQEGKSRLWLVPLDRSSPPQQIPNVEGASPRFTPGGEILFRGFGPDRSTKILYRVRPDGTGMQIAVDRPIAIMGEVSPDGRLVSAFTALPDNGQVVFQAIPLDGRPPIPFGGPDFGWLPGAVWFGGFENTSYIVPLPRGQMLPPIPAGGFRSEQEIARLPGARKIDAEPLSPGPSSDIYAFYRGTTLRNLYRIPIP
jgi:hypothetical protein